MSNIVEKQAEKVKREINGEVTFKDLKEYAKNIGVQVFYYSESETLIKIHNLELATKFNKSFIYANDEESTKVILISDAATNKLFLLAHELGHCLFHHGQGKTYEEEQEANAFAELLAGIKKHKEPIKPKKKGKKVIAALATLAIVGGVFGWYFIQSNSEDAQEPVITPPTTEQQKPANDVPNNETGNEKEQTFIITRTGDKYHLQNCYYVKDKTDTISLTIEEVLDGGYDPCKVCIGE